jgi:hypothetical protein
MDLLQLGGRVAVAAGIGTVDRTIRLADNGTRTT